MIGKLQIQMRLWNCRIPIDEFSRDTEVKKGNVIERSSWEYDISRLNEEEMR